MADDPTTDPALSGMMEGKGNTFAGLLANMQPTEGGSTATPPPIDTAATAADFAKGAAAMPKADPGDLQASDSIGMPTTAGMPPASTIPGDLSALGHPSFNPMDHMSFATALNLAYNPMAMQMLSHIQSMRHQQTTEQMQNMEFQRLADQHARDAQEHADTVKNAAETFRRNVEAAYGKFLKPGEQPGEGYGPAHSFYSNGQEQRFAMPTAERQAQLAKDAKAKDEGETTTVPDLTDPTGKKTIDLPLKYYDAYVRAATEAKRHANTNGEDVETKEVHRPDGHKYYQIIGKESGKLYHETDAGPEMAGEKEQELKQRQKEAADARQQAALDRKQKAEDQFKEHISKQLDIHGKNIGDALKANATEADAFREQENARQEWQQAQAKLEGLPKDAGDADKKQAAKDADASYKQMKKAEGAANSATENKIRAWQIARQHHQSLQAGPYSKYLDTGEENGIPFARFKASAAPGAEAVTGGNGASAPASTQGYTSPAYDPFAKKPQAAAAAAAQAQSQRTPGVSKVILNGKTYIYHGLDKDGQAMLEEAP